MDNTLPRLLRLRSASDFKQLFSSARRLNAGYISILNQRNGLQHARIGVTIAKS